MNQLILFPDREEWDDHLRSVCFPAQVNGFLVNCRVSAETLNKHETVCTEAEALTVFKEYRWDYEEEAELLIQNEEFDEQGWIVI